MYISTQHGPTIKINNPRKFQIASTIEDTLKYIKMFTTINANYLQHKTNILDHFELVNIWNKIQMRVLQLCEVQFSKYSYNVFPLIMDLN